MNPVPEPDRAPAGVFDLEEMAKQGGPEAEDAKKILEMRAEEKAKREEPKKVKYEAGEFSLADIQKAQAEAAAKAQAEAEATETEKAKAERNIPTQVIERPKKGLWQRMFGGK